MTARWLSAACLAAALWAQAPAVVPRKPAAAREKELAFPPLHAIQPPKMTSSQLSNGLKLFLVENHELPVVHGLVLVRTGSAFDPAEKAGLAHLTTNLMRTGGTRQKEAGQIDLALERMGARVDAVVSEVSAGLSFSAPRESAKNVLGVVQQMLAEPALRVEKLEVAKALLRGTLLRRVDDVETARRGFLSAIYGKESPYARQENDAAIGRIRQDDVLECYRRYYFPANVWLAIEGDFDSAAMKTAVEALFSSWKAEQPAVPEFPKASAAPVGTYAIPGKDLLHVHFAMGQLGGELRDRDSAAWEVLAEILGGTRRSRLLQNVQSPVPGDTTEIGAQWIPKYGYPGTLQIMGSCSELAFSTILQGIQKEVERLRTSGITDDELKIARETALARMAMGADTSFKRLGVEMAREYAGYPADFTLQYQKALASVTRADVERLAKALDPAHFQIVAVGDAQDLRRQLAAVGRTATVPDAAPTPGKTPPPAAPDSAAAERGRQLMAKAQQASGGADKVAALKDAARTAVWDLGAIAGGGQRTITDQWIAPNEFREESTGAGGSITYTDGNGGWGSDGFTAGILTSSGFQQVETQLFRWYPRLLLGDRVPGRSILAIAAQAVEIREGSRTARLTFDDAGLPSEILYEATAASGAPIAVEEVLQDFRDVGGLKLPFRVRILHNGQPAALVTVRDLKVNSGLKVDDLEKRP